MTAHNAAMSEYTQTTSQGTNTQENTLSVCSWGTLGTWYVFSPNNGGRFLTRTLAWTPHFSLDCFFSSWDEADTARLIVADLDKRNYNA